METEKLYNQDVFRKEFAARVTDCRPAKDGYEVVLDRTAFYPEGGGQPADRGSLNEIDVRDVHERQGVIYHLCAQPLVPGEAVTGRIDWARRFDHMQQHSGEHMLSGFLCALFDCANVGFHLGAETVTMDYNKELTAEQVRQAEELANRAVWEDFPVEISVPSPSELELLDYRSKRELTGAVRIVRFPGADCCACCGTHVERTGQVGLIKVLSCQKFRGGMRLEAVCGQRALDRLTAAFEQNRQIARQLSVRPAETARAVERMGAELAEANSRIALLEEGAFAAAAREYRQAGDVLLLWETMRPDAVRRLADAVAKSAGGLCGVFAGEDGGYAYALIQAEGKDISPLVKALNLRLKGRGGGKNGLAQGSVEATAVEIERFWADTLLNSKGR